MFERLFDLVLHSEHGLEVRMRGIVEIGDRCRGTIFVSLHYRTSAAKIFRFLRMVSSRPDNHQAKQPSIVNGADHDEMIV